MECIGLVDVIPVVVVAVAPVKPDGRFTKEKKGQGKKNFFEKKDLNWNVIKH
uniref:Uncharacterized protein n=1 Tax=Tetranychus urticae TaxID=32264 RepID=T1KP23_TETUR